MNFTMPLPLWAVIVNFTKLQATRKISMYDVVIAHGIRSAIWFKSMVNSRSIMRFLVDLLLRKKHVSAHLENTKWVLTCSFILHYLCETCQLSICAYPPDSIATEVIIICLSKKKNSVEYGCMNYINSSFIASRLFKYGFNQEKQNKQYPDGAYVLCGNT